MEQYECKKCGDKFIDRDELEEEVQLCEKCYIEFCEEEEKRKELEEEELSHWEQIRVKALPEKIANIINNFYKKTKGDTEASKKEWFKQAFKMLQEMEEMGFTGASSLITDLNVVYFKVYNKRFKPLKHSGYGV